MPVIVFGEMTFRLRKGRPKGYSPSRAQHFPKEVDSDWVFICDASESSTTSAHCSMASEEYSTEGKFTYIHNSPRTGDNLGIPSRTPSTAVSSVPSTARAGTACNDILWRTLRERTTYYDLRRNYAAQRSLLWNALSKLLTGAKQYLPVTDDRTKHAPPNSLQRLWNDVQDLMGFLREYDLKLSTSDDRLNVLEQKSKAIPQSTPISVNPAPVDPIPAPSFHTQEGWEHSSDDSSEPEIVQEYYRHAKAISYLSDELISMGPRPLQPSATGSSSRDVDKYDAFSEPLTPREYAERHLQLLRELRHARVEEARLRKLCEENKYELEEIVEIEDEEYKDMLNLMETGPPRIDSLLIESAHDMSTMPLQLESFYAGREGRITNWITRVSHNASTQPIGISVLGLETPNTDFASIDTELFRITTPAELADKAQREIQSQPQFVPEKLERLERRYSAPNIGFTNKRPSLVHRHSQSTFTPRQRWSF